MHRVCIDQYPKPFARHKMADTRETVQSEQLFPCFLHLIISVLSYIALATVHFNQPDFATTSESQSSSCRVLRLDQGILWFHVGR